MPQFNNMNELVRYLGNLESRVQALEIENGNLRAIQPRNEGLNENAIARVMAGYLPQTNIFSRSFLRRAFAIWGHFFVANLLIGIVVGIIYGCLMMALFGSMFGSLIQRANP